MTANQKKKADKSRTEKRAKPVVCSAARGKHGGKSDGPKTEKGTSSIPARAKVAKKEKISTDTQTKKRKGATPGSATVSKQPKKSANPKPMTTERLIEHRTATLDIYRKLSEARSKAGKPIPETVARSHKNLHQNRFLLAIVGKVKAGKSTFINGLIGKDLLPTDALQATAAIIEIFHAKKPFLRVTYANGATEEIAPNEGDSLAPLTEKLREVAAIRGENRDLPIAQLNDFIIERYNREAKTAEWEPEILELFLQNDLPNIHKISAAELQKRSRDYLDCHRDGKDVAMRVEVGYPNAYDFDHFRIVDTPGICAKGGFAERTLDFLINADGVIYLHKEEPAEDTLHDALQNVIPEKAKKHMLLVLTHKCQRTQQANTDYLTEAQKCCPQISKERIFIVDSLTEIVLQSIHGKDMDQIMDLCGQNEEWQNCIAKAYLGANRKRAEFFELLEKQSNMRSMKKEIFRMSEKSLGIQIETLLGAIQELYGELDVDAEARRDIFGLKLKPPQEFAAAMKREMEAMDELEADSAEKVAAIQREFKLDSPQRKFGTSLNKIITNAESEINGKEFGSGDTAKTADDYLMKINQDVEDSLQDLLDEIKATFHQTITDMEASLQADFDITVPKIPLTALLEQVRTEATETVTRTVKREDFWGRVLQVVTFGKGGNRTEEVQRLNATKYFKGAQTTFVRELWAKKQNLADSMKISIETACGEYGKSVHRKLNDRRKQFEVLPVL